MISVDEGRDLAQGIRAAAGRWGGLVQQGTAYAERTRGELQASSDRIKEHVAREQQSILNEVASSGDTKQLLSLLI